MRSIEQRPGVALQGVHLRKIVTEPLSYTAPSTNPPPLHSLPYLTKKKTLFYTDISLYFDSINTLSSKHKLQHNLKSLSNLNLVLFGKGRERVAEVVRKRKGPSDEILSPNMR